MQKEKRYSIGWMLLLFFGAITIFSASSDVRADEVTVQFERGRFEKTIQGSIRGDRYVDYIVGVAHPNQMLKVHMTASNPSNYFNVLPPTGETALFIGSTSGNDYEQRLIRPGNYRIRVYLMRNAARRNERSQYTIRIAVTGASGGAPGGGGQAMTPGQMMQECRIRAGREFRTRLPNIDTKYEGQRADGTHAVNGTAIFDGRRETFQCSFRRRGNEMIGFVVNTRPGRPTQLPSKPSGDALVPGTEFNATGTIPCARWSGQPMIQCKFGVVREGNGNGYIKVFWPGGGNRVIFCQAGAPTSYDQSQADGGARMKIGKRADLYLITIGDQRFEIPEAVISGG